MTREDLADDATAAGMTLAAYMKKNVGRIAAGLNQIMAEN